MTGNDGNYGGKRNPWGSPPPGGPRGPSGNNNRPGDFPDLEQLLKQAKRTMPPFGDGRSVFGIIIIAIIVWLASGLYRVQTSENAVVKRFGELVRVQTQSGLGYALPWPIDNVEKINVTLDRRVQIGFADSLGNGGGRSDLLDESLMLTADANIVDIDVVVLWNIAEAEKYLFNIRDQENTIKRVAESAIREVVGQTRLQTIITEGRDDVGKNIRTTMQSILDSYQSGVAVREVLIQEATVHPDVLEAYNDVAAARQDAERFQNEATIYRNDIIPRARGEAIQMLQDAQAYKQDVIARADGDAKRFTQILSAYRGGQDVTRDRFYIETMENVLMNANKLIIDQKGGVLPYLPLDQLKRAPAPEAPTTNQSLPQR